MLMVLSASAAAWAQGAAPPDPATLQGTLRGENGRRLSAAVVELQSTGEARASQAVPLKTSTDPNGVFEFSGLTPGLYTISVRAEGRTTVPVDPLTIRAGDHLTMHLRILPGPAPAHLEVQLSGTTAVSSHSSSGENLGSQQVSNLPLEQRDSTKLLLLAAGTNTTTSIGNFTQQYSIHGQKSTEAVFALDGATTTDPELGGATISDFNVDAIQGIDAESGLMPASIGQGAAGYTNVISKAGTDQIHGVVFEFLRNSALDARNFFDHSTPINPGRLPPFRRNQFGATNGGPVVLPGLYDGRGHTQYFFEYQGLRQIQGTTQVLSVPSVTERAGMDTTVFPGDTLFIPISPQIARALAFYPLPNNPNGTYGPRTYDTDSKVATSSDQFSIRIDHRLSDRSSLMGRFTLENIVGPTTNPNQTAINPSFAQIFTEGYRSVALHYILTPSPSLALATVIGFIRSSPLYRGLNFTQPGITFAGNVYEPINSLAGGTEKTFSNQFQVRQTVTKIHGSHIFSFGGQILSNRDTEVSALNINGSYTFGGGPVYSPVEIFSASGQHNIAPGELLPDTVSALLTATPYSYIRSMGGRGFPGGTHTGEAGPRREMYGVFFQDNWRVTPHVLFIYGLRYEVNPPIYEAHRLTSGPEFLGPDGRLAPYNSPGVTQQFLVNPQPPWPIDWKGLGPRMSVEWQVREKTLLRAGAGITTLVAYPWPNTSFMNGFPFSVAPAPTAQIGIPVPFSNTISTFVPPAYYTPQGALVYPTPSSPGKPNTPIDFNRFEQDLAALLPGGQIEPVDIQGQARDFSNGYIGTYTLGVQQQWSDYNFSATYIGIAGVGIPGGSRPNNYPGATPGFAPFSQFNSTGQFIGGFGTESIIDNSGHSTYHAGEFVLRKAPTRWGVELGASYTFSKSIDNAVSWFGGTGSGSGPVANAPAADPQDIALEKGRSSFDIRHNLSFSVSVKVPFPKSRNFAPTRAIGSNWQIEGIGQFSSGRPFSIFSGVQQTGYGHGGGDRPDQIGTPQLSTSRHIREDYFGLGANNPSYFSIPIHLPNGSGPLDGRLGTLGRNTFTGPPLRNFDMALFRDFTVLKRDKGDAAKVEFRAEFYNILNIVNFGLPNNVLTGSGFGIINSTAADARQLQFSLKFMY